jgi:putative DNA primase/helicase
MKPVKLDRFGRGDPYAYFHFLNELQPQSLDWLWPNRIPLAKLTLLIGDPGLGKSLLAADLAARVTTAAPWPDQPPSPRAPHAAPEHATPPHAPAPATPAPSAAAPSAPAPTAATSNFVLPPSDLATAPPYHPITFSPYHRPAAGVLYVAPEDSPADTLRPRLLAAGADLSCICVLTGVTLDDCSPYALARARRLNPEDPALDAPPDSQPFVLPDHRNALVQAIRTLTTPRLVILDPLSAMLAPGAQANAAAITEAVNCLSELAQRYNVAMLAISHLVKNRSNRTLYRVRGSVALIAAARAAHLLSVDPGDPTRRILSPLKCVYHAPPPPLAFRIAEGPRLQWNAQPAPGDRCLPDDLLDLDPDAYSALAEACDWLADRLAAGPQPAREVITAARAAGHPISTLRRAKRLLAVQSIKRDVDSPWLWTAQSPPYPSAPDYTTADRT